MWHNSLNFEPRQLQRSGGDGHRQACSNTPKAHFLNLNLTSAPEGFKKKRRGRANSPRLEDIHAQPTTCGARNIWQFRWQFVGNSRQFAGFSGNSGFGRRPECGDGGNSVHQSLAFNNLKCTPHEHVAPRVAEGARFLEFYVGGGLSLSLWFISRILQGHAMR